MKYIDIHAHVFPDNIAEKVIRTLENFYGYAWFGKGTAADLLKSMEEASITRSVIFSAATKPEQVMHINDYIASLQRANPEKFIGFGTLHPDFPDRKAEIARICELGLHGLKFHPDFQQIYIDQPGMMKIYEALPPDFPVIFHVGDKKLDFSSPVRLARVLDRFPHLNAIAAHMGAYAHWDEGEQLLAGRGIYVDISSTIGQVDPEKIRHLIQAYTPEKVLFGSDYPAVRHTQAIQDVLSLNLSPEDNEKIFYKNAERLFGRTFN